MSWVSYVFSLSPLITAGVTLAIAVITFLKSRREVISKVFIFWMVVSGINAILFFLMQIQPVGEEAMVLVLTLVQLIGALDPAIAIHFGMLFTQRRVTNLGKVGLKRISHYRRGYISNNVFIVYVPWLFLLIASMLYNLGTFMAIVLYYNALMYGFLTYVLVLLYFHYRNAHGEGAARSMIVFVGMAIIYVNAIAQEITGFTQRFATFTFVLQLVLVPLSSIIFAYAVMKMNLLGTQVVLRKGVAYTFVSLFTVAIFVAIEEGAEEVIQMTLLGEVPLASVIAALGVAAMFSPVEKFSRRLANRIFPHLLMDEERKVRIDAYRSVLLTAWSDGKITPKEAEMLAALRRVLEISEKEHDEIEGEVVEAMGVFSGHGLDNTPKKAYRKT